MHACVRTGVRACERCLLFCFLQLVVAVLGQHKEDTARGMFNTLPLAVTRLIHSPEWEGADLLHLKSEVQRPSATDVATNAPWIEAVIRKYSDRAR